MKRLNNRKGFTVTELIVAMAVLAILGTVVTSLVRAGLSAYNRVSETTYTETEARTALSLFTTQIRKHDATEAIIVVNSRQLGLREDPNAADRNVGTMVWFDSDDNTVYATDVFDVTGVPDKSAANPIAEVFDIVISNDPTPSTLGLSYTITVFYGDGGGKRLSQTITQRSAAAAPVTP